MNVAYNYTIIVLHWLNKFYNIHLLRLFHCYYSSRVFPHFSLSLSHSLFSFFFPRRSTFSKITFFHNGQVLEKIQTFRENILLPHSRTAESHLFQLIPYIRAIFCLSSCVAFSFYFHRFFPSLELRSAVFYRGSNICNRIEILSKASFTEIRKFFASNKNSVFLHPT